MGEGVKTEGPTLYRAPYVVPVTSPVLADGGVLVDGGRIVGADRVSRLRPAASRVVELEGRIITPALINCHCHLELSYLAGLEWDDKATSGGMTAWIRLLLAKRSEAVEPTSIQRAAREALNGQYLRGVGLVADIGNLPATPALVAAGPAEVLFFQELLGVTAPAAEAALAALAPEFNYTAHAPYSCHPRLIQALKEQSRQSGRVFPIHVAESAAEVEFLHTGRGPFHDFLAERLTMSGALANGEGLLAHVAVPGCGAIEYLHGLGVLDRQTICVHSVHISAAEADLIATARAKVCLCPGSNRRLGVGKAPVPLLLARHILPGLGTDSLASNDCLDLWQEMQVLQGDQPGLDPERIFAMATRGGAETLGVEERLGAIAPGREARLLGVPYDGPAAEIYSFLVNNGRAMNVEWLEAKP